MRVDGTEVRIRAPYREPRLVVAIMYDVGSLYITSHTGMTNVPGTEIPGALESVSTTSQRLSPLRGFTTVGSMSFDVVDRQGILTDALRDQLTDQLQGARGREVRLFTGDDDDFTDASWRRVATHVISGNIEYLSGGGYRFQAEDRTREMREEICEPATTNLTATLEIGDTTVNVISTAGFNTLEHTASFADAPLQTVGYLRVKKTGEIIRYTSKTATQFQGCTRGVNSLEQAIAIQENAEPERQPEIEELIYYEMPAPQMVYTFLTGTILGTSIEIPESHHLGIDTDYVDADSFNRVGRDLFNSSDYDAGLVLSFVGVEKTDGKTFIEEQILAPAWLYLHVNPEGKIQLRRYTRMLSDASEGRRITEDDLSEKAGELILNHETDQVVNQVRVLWHWNGEEYTREDEFFNATSADIHGAAGLRELSWSGLRVTRHSRATLQRAFDGYTDLFGGPPLSMSVPLLPEHNDLEVGDVVRCDFGSVRDMAGTGTLNRTFMVQQVSTDWVSGEVLVDLFGSSAQVDPDAPATSLNPLADTWYESEGSDLASELSIVGGVVQSSGTLTGGADLTDAGSIFYFGGDLTIPDGVTVTIENNVQLRIMGALTVNGTIDGAGNGRAGITSTDVVSLPVTVPPSYNHESFIGWTVSGDGLRRASGGFRNVQGYGLRGQVQAMPRFALSVEDGVLYGMPSDLRGTPGCFGAPILDDTLLLDVLSEGGAGGASGAGLAIVCRETPAFGLSGTINLSGADGSQSPTAVNNGGYLMRAGGGAGGSPGGLLVVLDNDDAPLPDLTNAFVANRGATPIMGTPVTPAENGFVTIGEQPAVGVSTGLSGGSYWRSHSAVQWAPADLELGEGAAELLPQPVVVSVTPTLFGSAIEVESIPEAEYDVIEVWGSITDEVADATLLYSGRGTMLLVPLDRLVTYTAFLRTRQGARVSAWHDDAGTQMTGGGQAIPPIALGDTFVETFDGYSTQADFESRWQIVYGSPTITFTENGENGGRAMRVVGSMVAMLRENVPYDAVNSLYRQEAKFRPIVAHAGQQTISFGVLGVKADGQTLIDEFGNTSPTAFAETLLNNYDIGGVSLNSWRRCVEWLAGTNEDASALSGFLKAQALGPFNYACEPCQPKIVRRAADTTAPRYVRPVIGCNLYASTTATCEIDYFSIRRREITEAGQPGLLDPNFSAVDDEEYWILTGGAVASVYEVGGGIDGKNAIRFNMVGASNCLCEARYPILLTGDSAAVRIYYRITGSVVGTPTLTCFLLGRRRNQYQRLLYWESVGGTGYDSEVVSFSSLNADGDWHPYTFNFANLFSTDLDEADLIKLRFLLQSGNGSDNFQFRIGRSRFAQTP